MYPPAPVFQRKNACTVPAFVMSRPTFAAPLVTTCVKVPVAGVVAPTVPLILMLAVPVRFVATPDDGVPSAPLNVTKAPAEPTLTPSAVATPVPSPVMLPTAGVIVAELTVVNRP